MALQGSLRVLVAEDDRVQLDTLVEWIGMLRPNWQVVAATSDVPSTLRSVEDLAPDLLLIDIHMGNSNDEGPLWVKSIDAGTPIIFVTGDPDFAIHAFEAQAVDYILKPVTLKRLKASLDRAAVDPRLVSQTFVRAAESDDEPLTWLTMSRGAEVVMVPLHQVIYLQADLKYTRVVSQRGEGLVRMGITELCQRVADPGFVKIHRSIVVNLNYVASIKRNDLGQMDVHLNERSEVLRVSKTFQHVFRTN